MIDFIVEENRNVLPKCPESGKTCFSKKEAETSKNWMNRNGKRKYEVKRIYHCEYCNCWHITHVQNWRQDTKK